MLMSKKDNKKKIKNTKCVWFGEKWFKNERKKKKLRKIKKRWTMKMKPKPSLTRYWARSPNRSTPLPKEHFRRWFFFYSSSLEPRVYVPLLFSFSSFGFFYLYSFAFYFTLYDLIRGQRIEESMPLVLLCEFFFFVFLFMSPI